MVRKLLIPLLGLALVWAVVGCSSNPSNSTAAAPGDLNAKFGGYTTSSELPGFGNADLLAQSDGEVSYNDPLQLSPSVDSLVQAPDAGFFVLRVTWGRLEHDSSVTTPTVWDGSLTISRGAELVRRVIRFEPNQDMVQPRTDPKVIEWVSTTTTDYDGLLVDMYFPRPVPTFDTTQTPQVDTLGDTTWVTVVDTVYPGSDTVSFETGPYSRTFGLGDLVALDTVVYLDDSNAVAFHALKLDRIPCARGFLAGHWGRDDSGNGVFRGMWMSRYGSINGWLRGSFGRDNSGKNVFYGKWIDQSGMFQGLLSGTWAFMPDRRASVIARRHAGGWFAGKIFDASESEIGQLKGRFMGPDHPVKAGYFQGIWHLNCGDSTADTWRDMGDRNHDGWDDARDSSDGGE